MGLSPSEMKEVYRGTEIIRKPRYGIVTGYHELPYVCLGSATTDGFETTRVRGRVHVSPRFLIRPPHCEPSYDDIFGEENVDAGLAGRVFGFLGFQGEPIECKSEFIEVKHLNRTIDRVLAETLDGLERQEDITTGVIITPNSRYYPVSIERFISSILHDEFEV